MKKRAIPLPTARLLNQQQAAAYCGIGVATFKAHVRISPVKIGSKCLFDVRDLDRAIENDRPEQPLKDWLGEIDAGSRERA